MFESLGASLILVSQWAKKFLRIHLSMKNWKSMEASKSGGTDYDVKKIHQWEAIIHCNWPIW